jgi:hypothetical protein
VARLLTDVLRALVFLGLVLTVPVICHNQTTAVVLGAISASHAQHVPAAMHAATHLGVEDSTQHASPLHADPAVESPSAPVTATGPLIIPVSAVPAGQHLHAQRATNGSIGVTFAADGIAVPDSGVLSRTVVPFWVTLVPTPTTPDDELLPPPAPPPRRLG